MFFFIIIIIQGLSLNCPKETVQFFNFFHKNISSTDCFQYISWEHITMICDVSCDSEDWSNDDS